MNDLEDDVTVDVDRIERRAARRRRTRIQVGAAAVVGLLAVVGVGAVTWWPSADSREVGELTANERELTAEEVERLTQFGKPFGSGEFDDAAVERAWQQKWGLKDIAVVPIAMKEAAARFPGANGGTSYDPDTLTYTQWVVTGSRDAAELRAAVQTAFDGVAAGSNINLAFGESQVSRAGANQLTQELAAARVEDRAWPDGVPLTGEFRADRGKYVLDVGPRFDDSDVVAYFDRHWPGLVELSPVSMGPEPAG